MVCTEHMTHVHSVHSIHPVLSISHTFFQTKCSVDNIWLTLKTFSKHKLTNVLGVNKVLHTSRWSLYFRVICLAFQGKKLEALCCHNDVSILQRSCYKQFRAACTFAFNVSKARVNNCYLFRETYKTINSKLPTGWNRLASPLSNIYIWVGVSG